MSPSRRQTRGVLWDVIAPWVRWPLRSPRRLFTVLVAIVILVVLWHVASGAATTTEPTAPAGDAAPSTTSSSAQSSSTGAGSTTGVGPSATVTTVGHPGAPSSSLSVAAGPATTTPTDPVVPAGSAEAAQGFVTAWARPSLPADQWLAGVRGYLAPELERSMSYTDPAQIDATTVTGPARMVHLLPNGTAASFEVPTDAGVIRVELALVEGRWVATDIGPASATGPGD